MRTTTINPRRSSAVKHQSGHQWQWTGTLELMVAKVSCLGDPNVNTPRDKRETSEEKLCTECFALL